MRLLLAFCTLIIGLAAAVPARADNVALLNLNTCADSNGISVGTEWLPGHEDANIENGRPVIQLDPKLIDQFPPVMAQFLYYHECGHHALGEAGPLSWTVGDWISRGLNHPSFVLNG
jgi:hypothetical protein